MCAGKQGAGRSLCVGRDQLLPGGGGTGAMIRSQQSCPSLQHHLPAETSQPAWFGLSDNKTSPLDDARADRNHHSDDEDRAQDSRFAVVPVGSCIIEGTYCLTRSSPDGRQGGACCPETPREGCMLLLPWKFEVEVRSRSMTVCIDGVCLVLITTDVKHQGSKYSTSGSRSSMLLAFWTRLLTPNMHICSHTDVQVRS